ncbi:hypothetical protein ACFY9N_05840 [Microbacterium sp. NPDC008134]|uniref:hypothetical protein n=1 Tax=Microbacterium sp. NPDC008134 TaxID=3364183 RepID=UPI0036E01920
MQVTDAPERALALLDRAVLMRLDPDPLVSIRLGDKSEDAVQVGTREVNPELYLDILSNLHQAASLLGSLGWHLSARQSDCCMAPHFTFAMFEWALRWASSTSERRMIKRLDKLLDGRGFHGENFRHLHDLLARRISGGTIATCSSVAHQKL